MTYLLDVNALLAWSHPSHDDHGRLHAWAAEVGARNLRSCALTELGFLRISMQPAAFDNSREVAAAALDRIKAVLGDFVDHAPAPDLPAWAATAGRTTDAYLMQLARTAGMKLATLERGTPGAFVIPELSPP